jgi:hypothetical protein
MKLRLAGHVLLSAAVIVLSNVAGVSRAIADPGHNTSAVILAGCDNGERVLLNLGTLTNRSHQAFVVASSGAVAVNSIYVMDYLAFTDSAGTSVIFETGQGLQDQRLVTCTVTFSSGSMTARGFFTSRGAVPAVRTSSSRLLCKSYGGLLQDGPDEVLALANPVIWVCNDLPSPFDVDAFFDKLNALAIGCVADGGIGVYGTLFSDRGPVAELDSTCYGR